MGQPLWQGPGGKTDYNPLAFRAQYTTLWDALWKAPFDVLMLSGDVHHSRALRLTNLGRQLCEFVSSPVSHIPTVVTSVLPWKSQGTDKVSILTPTGSKPELRYEFGTTAPNSVGILRLTPKTDTCVDVGATFLDYSSAQPRTATLALEAAPGYRAQFPSCAVERLWSLKARA
jgi:hypothetical protein